MDLKKSLLLIIAVLIIDQITKIYIKTNFALGESVEVFSWFKILFIENEGAAWGTKISDILPVSESVGKLFLTIFRLFAIAGIGYWLLDIIKKQSPRILILAVSLIFAGALGNIIDSVFYGVLFDESPIWDRGRQAFNGELASLFSNEPYGNIFYGKVVDMLYFPLIDTTWPEWFPWVGGKRFSFFDPIFNIADSAISIGVALLLVFNKRAFQKFEEEEETEED